MTPETGLDTFFWQLLLIPAALYVILYIVGNVFDGRGNPLGETLHDIGFLLILVTAAYTAVLTIVALVSKPELVGDMLLIIAILVGFFALLVVALYLLFEVMPRRLRRGERG